MTKGQLNIAAAELQEKVNRIEATREKALQTAASAVGRKYAKQLTALIDTKVTCSTDGEQQEFLYPREVVSRVEFPEWYNLVVHGDMNNDTIEDLTDDEAYLLPDEVKS